MVVQQYCFVFRFSVFVFLVRFVISLAEYVLNAGILREPTYASMILELPVQVQEHPVVIEYLTI